MDQRYVYEEEQAEEGLTFKKLGGFFKRGWLIMLVAIVVAVLLSAAVALPLKYLVKSEPVGETSIEFIYDGIDNGLDPAGGTLNVDNIVSMSVLGDAVERANLGDVITSITDLREATRVEAVLPKAYVELQQAAADGDQNAINALRDYELHPTRYTVVISNPKNLGLTDAQTVELLDKIIAAYTDDFKKRFSVTEMFDTTIYVQSESATIEYFDIYDMYIPSFVPVTEYITELQTEAPTFVSTSKGGNTTFSALINDIMRLQAEYVRFNSFLLSNNIWKDKVTADTLLENRKTDITAKLKNLTDNRITPLKEQIDKIKPNKITSTDSNGSVVVTESYPQEYYKYQDELNELNSQAYAYNSQLSDIELRKKDLNVGTPTSKELLDRADAMIKSLEAATKELIEKVNATVTDYYDTTFISSSVRVVAPPVITRRTISFSLVVVLVVAAIVGFAVGCIANGIIIAKAAKKAKAAADKDEEDKTPAQDAAE